MKTTKNHHYLSFALGVFFAITSTSVVIGYLFFPIIFPQGILSQFKGDQATSTVYRTKNAKLPKPSMNVGWTNEKNYGIAAGGGLTFLNENSLDLYFRNLSEIGVNWVRWDFDWSAIQPGGPAEFKWADLDRVVRIAKKYEINSIGIITYAPKWAATQGCESKVKCSPKDPKQFGLFAGQVAARYKNSIDYWEIWNEPNYSFFFGPNADVQKYVDLLKLSSVEIKKANSKAFVLTGGLAPSGGSVEDGISPIDFIKNIYSMGGGRSFDAIALHPYSYPVLPDFPIIWNQITELSAVRQIMIDNGDERKQIWITEIGAPTSGPGRKFVNNQFFGFKYGSDFMSEASQAELLDKLNNLYLQTDWIGMFFWYTLTDNSDKKDDPENFFGLIGANGIKKAAYYEFKNIVSH